ncbi:MAG: MotA/TolQ/ExbB proton channel family protein [Rhodothalassiaceae bacterium]
MPLSDFLLDAQIFFGRGGWPLVLIILAAWLMWVMIFARLWFFTVEEPRLYRALHQRWAPWMGQESWGTEKIRRQLLSEHRQATRRLLRPIATLVKISPLLGLLGTVLGMIEVFEVMAIQGSGNVRAMAAGISKATLTTMAGMVAAISGLVVSAQLNRRAAKAEQRILKAFEA